jgi:hypothetical protein
LVYWTRPTTGNTNLLALTAVGFVEAGVVRGFTPRFPKPSTPGYCAELVAATPADRQSKSRSVAPRRVKS